MWLLRLFSLASFFSLGSTAAGFALIIDSSACTDWIPDINHLVPYLLQIVAIEKGTRRVEKSQLLELVNSGVLSDFKGGRMNYEKIPINVPTDNSKYDYEILMNVIASGNSSSNGFDNPIYYGSGPLEKYTGIFEGSPPKNFKNYPFRFNKFKIFYEDDNGNEFIFFDATTPNSKQFCSDKENEAWIANHGIYRLVKQPNGIILFKNHYYFPRPGLIFT